MPRGKGMQVDDSVLRHKIRKLLKRLNIDEKEFVKEETGFLARDFARYTPPYAVFPSRGTSIGTGKDKKAGEFAMLGDLNKIFFVPDDDGIYNWALKEFPSGNIYKRDRIIGMGVARSIAEMEAHHRRMQNPRTGRIRVFKLEQAMWVSARLFKKYYNAEKKKVGISKASLAKSASFFNPKIRVPAWVSRHFALARGSARLDVKKSKPSGIFKASAPGITHLSAGIISRVNKARLIAMDKKLVKRFKHEAKLVGFDLTKKP